MSRPLLVTTWFPPFVGGAPNVYDNLCRQLGSRMSVLATSHSCLDLSELEGWAEYDAASRARIHRVEHLRYPNLSDPRNLAESVYRLLVQDIPFRRKLWKDFARVVEKERPDVLCIGDLYPLSWLALRAMDRYRLPVVFYVHGEEITQPNTSRIWKREGARAMRAAAGLIAVSSFTKAELAAAGVAAERVQVINNGVDTDTFVPGGKDAASIARHRAAGRKILLTVARLQERKGVDRMIQAMPAILEGCPDALYLIVGAGPERSRLEELRDSLGLRESVVFCGSPEYGDYSTLVRYYQTCDVFVMPNRTLANGDTEGFGLVFLEASACGKPVVGGNAGGAPDAIRDGQTGFVVDSASTEKIAGATLRLLLDPKLAAAMGAAGRRWAEESSWKRRAEEFESYLSRIVAAATAAN